MRHNEPVACPAFAKKGPRFTGMNTIDTTFYIQLSELVHSFPNHQSPSNCHRHPSSPCGSCQSDTSNLKTTAIEERDNSDRDVKTEFGFDQTQTNTPRSDNHFAFSFQSLGRMRHSSLSKDSRSDCETNTASSPGKIDPLTVPDSPSGSGSQCRRPKFNIKSIVREGNLFLFHLIAGEVVCSDSADSLTKDLVSYLSNSNVPLLGVSRVYKCDIELSYDFESQLTTITRLRLVQEEDL